jgi:hypothetical protein
MSYEEEDTCHMRRRIHVALVDVVQRVSRLSVCVCVHLIE